MAKEIHPHAVLVVFWQDHFDYSICFHRYKPRQEYNLVFRRFEAALLTSPPIGEDGIHEGRVLPIVADIRVNVCALKVRVPHQILNCTDISTIVQEMRYKGVPQTVWKHLYARTQANFSNG